MVARALPSGESEPSRADVRPKGPAVLGDITGGDEKQSERESTSKQSDHGRNAAAHRGVAAEEQQQFARAAKLWQSADADLPELSKIHQMLPAR